MLDKRLPFYIKKNSTLPMLKYPLTEVLMEKHGITDEMLENCAITFSMYNLDEDTYKIANKEARLLINEDFITNPDDEKYLLVYKFSIQDTSKCGHFESNFTIDFLGDNCGKITFPTSEKINIFIQNSLTKTTVV